MKRKLIGILISILIMAISGCISTNGEYSVSNSKFQIPEGWSNLQGPGIGANQNGFAYGDKQTIIMVIEQYTNESEFNSEYSSYSQFGSAYNVTTSTKTINGTQIKVFKIIHNTTPNLISTYYYFQKNGKYYSIYFDDTRNNKDQSIINTAIEKVFSTLN